ncbi:MAG: nitrite reductase small subunit [Mycobacterium sp.]|nr:nitrite reductase small subunit [Mycobacterium sp.]
MTIHHIGSIDDIPVGEGRAYVVDGTEIAVYRLRDGTLRALGAVCPHRGGPLADGLIDDCVVVCPLHGHTYDLSTGAELPPPATQSAPTASQAAQTERSRSTLMRQSTEDPTRWPHRRVRIAATNPGGRIQISM